MPEVEMTESQRRWEAWFDAYARITDAWPDELEIPCPDGDGGRVRVAYMGGRDDRIGTAVAWCDQSLSGIYVHRVDIPEGAPAVPFGSGPEVRNRVIPPGIHFLQPDPVTEPLPD